MIEYSYDPPYNLWSGNRSDTLNKWKINYKGSIATASALPEKGDFKGDTYNVLEDGSNYMWNGSSWDKLDANVYVGATSTKDGVQGLVPPADSSERNKFLRGDGTYKDVTWSAVTGKPSVFPPDEHTHDWSQITNGPVILPKEIYVDPVNGDDSNFGDTAATALKSTAELRNRIDDVSYIVPKAIAVNLANGNYNEELSGIYGVRLAYNATRTAGEAAIFPLGIIADHGANISLYGNFVTKSLAVVRNGYCRLVNSANITFDAQYLDNSQGTLIFVYQNGTLVSYSGSTINFNIKGNCTVTNGLYQIIGGGVVSLWGNEVWTILDNSSFTGPKYNIASCGVGNSILSSSLPGTTGVIDSVSFVN